MTPHERAIKTAEKVTQWFWARTMTNATNCDAGEKYAAEQIEQAIIADRQSLQSEIERRLQDRDIVNVPSFEADYKMAVDESIRIVQSVFAQQSQPEESKPHAFQGRSDRWCEVCNQPDRAEIHKVLVDVAFQQSIITSECERRVLVEREACAKIADNEKEEAKRQGLKSTRETDFELWKGKEIASDWIQQKIRARSNQPEEKQSLTPFDPSCSTCVREAKEEAEAEENAKKKPHYFTGSFRRNCLYCNEPFGNSVHKPSRDLGVKEEMPEYDQSARIATLQEWLATDARIIQQLNESNNALSLKIAQLEKEKNELAQKEELNPPIQHRYEMCGSERCPACVAGISQ